MIVVVVDAWFTICVIEAELIWNEIVGLYVAVIVCVPALSVEVLKLALPLTRETVPNRVVPSSNVTDPVGIPPPLEVTVAVKVTLPP